MEELKQQNRESSGQETVSITDCYLYYAPGSGFLIPQSFISTGEVFAWNGNCIIEGESVWADNSE